MHILIVRNNSNSQAVETSLVLGLYLDNQGIGRSVWDADGPLFRQDERTSALAQDSMMAVVLGGDGTILRAAHLVGSSGVPILGINFGHLGFLANPSDEGAVALVGRALAGELSFERRTNLKVTVVCDGQLDPIADDCGPSEWPQGENAPDHRCPLEFFALNELAVTRGANGRIIEVGLTIAGQPIDDVRGDGFVVASATGSTAYALSAGGPVLAPLSKNLVAVPISPHSLRGRAIVTDPSDVVELDLSRNEEGRDATVFIDGELLDLPAPVRRIYVQRGDAPTVLLRSGSQGFYRHVSEVFF